jgi:hypothetical protein
MKVIYPISNPFASAFFAQLAHELQRMNVTLQFVTESRYVERFMQRSKIECTNISSRLGRHQFNPNHARSELEGKWAFSPERLTYDTSYLLSGKHTSAEYLCRLLDYLDAWTEALDRIRPDVVMSGDGVEPSFVTFLYLAEQRRIPRLYTYGAGLISSGMVWDRSIMLNTWVKSNPPEVFSHIAAREFIADTLAKKTIIGWQLDPAVYFRKFLRHLHFYLRGYEEEAYYEPTQIARETLRSFLNKRKFRKFWKPVQPAMNKSIFLPLHVLYDSQIAMKGRPFLRQDKLVRFVASRLPQGYELVVKPHPAGVGIYPPDWIENISSTKNVRMVGPGVSAHDLINRCGLVLTVNSDVGWEALLHRKPVVVLARPFYSQKGLTHDVLGPHDLEDKLESALSAAPIDMELLVQFVKRVLNSHYPCSLYDEAGEFDTRPDNITKFAASFLSEYESSDEWAYDFQKLPEWEQRWYETTKEW